MFRSIFFFVILFLHLFVGNLYAANYYVSTASSGNASANSWNNQQTYTNFNWSQLNGGDTVFVDGGTYTSRLYMRMVNPTSTVVITKGKETGHNGEVIFSSTGGYDYSCNIVHSSNVKLTGLTFKWLLTDNRTDAVVHIDSSSSFIYFNSCHITGTDYGGFRLQIENSSFISVTNNLMDGTSGGYNNEQDCINISLGGGGHTITGNTLIPASLFSDQHLDCIQIGYLEGQTNNYVTTIANNFLCAPLSKVNAQGIYIDGTGSNRFLIYNNIILTGSDNTSITAYRNTVSPYHTSMQMYNNTIVNKKFMTFEAYNLDTLILKNNIFIVDTIGRTGAITVIKDSTGIGYKNIDYNQYFQRGHTIEIQADAYNPLHWNQWQALGYDTHSDTGIVNFANIWGNNATDYELVTGSGGIDKGIAIPLTSTAFDGTIRPQGKAYDRGAFESF